MTDVPLAMGSDVVPNLDADEPGSNPEINNEHEKLHAEVEGGLDLGVQPCWPRGVSGHDDGHRDAQALDHRLGHKGDHGEARGWVCLYLMIRSLASWCPTEGGTSRSWTTNSSACTRSASVTPIEWGPGRNVRVVKVSDSQAMVREMYNIIAMLCPDFVNIYNGFNFDLRCLAASGALGPL